MSQNENNNKGGFAIGVLLGGLIGAGVAYFLSSKDQEENRRLLKKKGKVILKNISELKDNAIEKGEEFGEAVSDKFVEIKDNASEMVGEKVQEFKDGLEDFPKVAQETIEKVQESAQKLEKTAEKEIGKTQSRIKKFFVKKGKSLSKK